MRSRPPRIAGRPTSRFVVTCVLSLLAILVLAAAPSGCGGTSDTSTTTGGATATSRPALSTTTMPTMMDPESRLYMEDMKRTLAAMNAVSADLEAEQAPSDDPRVAVVFGLRARSQAITALKAAHEKQLQLADDCVDQMIVLLNRAAVTEQGEAALALAAARALVPDLTHPSEAPAEATTTLNQIISALEPLLP